MVRDTVRVGFGFVAWFNRSIRSTRVRSEGAWRLCSMHSDSQWAVVSCNDWIRVTNALTLAWVMSQALKTGHL